MGIKLDESEGEITNRTVQPKRVVIKLGTNLLTRGKDSLDLDTIRSIVSQIAVVRASGIEVLIVSSGAVAAGRESLSRTPGKRKLQRGTVAYRQTLAALGQPQLMMMFERIFAESEGMKWASVYMAQSNFFGTVTATCQTVFSDRF